MNLSDYRLAVFAALQTIPNVADGTWTASSTPLDAIQPPAYVVQWGPDPWRTAFTNGHDTVALEVVAVAGRVTVEGGFPILEALVDAAVNALAAARLRPAQVLRPGPLEIGNVTYLAARLQIRQPVEVLSHA